MQTNELRQKNELREKKQRRRHLQVQASRPQLCRRRGADHTFFTATQFLRTNKHIKYTVTQHSCLHKVCHNLKPVYYTL